MPGAGRPWSRKVHRADCPGHKNVPRAGRPRYMGHGHFNLASLEPIVLCGLTGVRAIGRVFIFRLQIDDGLIPDCVPAPRSLMIICEVVSAQRTLGPGASFSVAAPCPRSGSAHNTMIITQTLATCPSSALICPEIIQMRKHNGAGQGEITSTHVRC